MRFATRILLGVAAATALAVAAPVAASADTTVSASAQALTDPTTTSWGSYYSADHRAKANGEVSVEEKRHKKWYTKKYVKWEKKCWWKNGKKICKPVRKTHTVRKFKWVETDHFTVDSTLYNKKAWGSSRSRCSWETFKVVKFDGSVDFESFKNCQRRPVDHSFSGTDAERIQVQVSRGNSHRPTSRFGGWNTIYSAA
ncbi:hypothetical protein [Streptosporangium sp. KLBMP 9127]|nr:hypothetical protein [Streptosporangium sp. KLBMP 9127]